MAEPLSIWMHGFHVGTIEQDRRSRLRLSYTQSAIRQYNPGTPLLSIRLPVAHQHYSHGVAAPFLEGLLPEGAPRRVVAERFDLATSDTFGLLRALGRDCAGAMIIQPEEEAAPTTPGRAPQRLTNSELADLITNLRSAPLGVDGDVRLSLAGVQEKLVLARLPDGAWGRPVGGAPSTHLLKPGLREYPSTVENEAFCMRFASHLGIDAAHIETLLIGDDTLLAVARFDRFAQADGNVERIHQEDFCQALGVLPINKYESMGGPSFRQIARVLESAADARSHERLLEATVLNVLIGNGDAHGKNYSLLYQPDGRLRLAPLYDLLCTRMYPELSANLAMHIDAVRKIDDVTSARILNEAESWGMQRGRAREVLAELLEQVPAAIDTAASEIEDVPPALIRYVRQQSKVLRETLV